MVADGFRCEMVDDFGFFQRKPVLKSREKSIENMLVYTISNVDLTLDLTLD